MSLPVCAGRAKFCLLSSIDPTCPFHCVGAAAHVVFLQMWLNLYPCKRACLCPLHRSPALFKLSASIRGLMLLFSHALERQRARSEYWAGKRSGPEQRMQRRKRKNGDDTFDSRGLVASSSTAKWTWQTETDSSAQTNQRGNKCLWIDTERWQYKNWLLNKVQCKQTKRNLISLSTSLNSNRYIIYM